MSTWIVSDWDIEDTENLGGLTPVLSTTGPVLTLIFFYTPIGLFFAIWVFFVDANIIGRVIVILLGLYFAISSILFLQTTIVISRVIADDSLVLERRSFFRQMGLSRYPEGSLSVHKSWAHVAVMGPDRRYNLVHTSLLLSFWIASKLRAIGMEDFDPRVHSTPPDWEPDFRIGQFKKYQCSECQSFFEVDQQSLPATISCPSCDRSIDLPAPA